MSAAILVLVEHARGTVADISFEMLGAARSLAAATAGQVEAVLVGDGVADLAGRLGTADRVFVLDDPAWAQPTPEAIVAVLQSLRERQPPGFVLLGGTIVSFGLGARLAARAGLPFLNFCKGLRIEAGTAVFTSQLFGGKILCEVKLPGNQGIVNICPGAFPGEAGRSDREPPVERISAPAVASTVTFRRFIEPAAGDVDITQHDVLVSVGRGIQGAENLPLAEELAQALGGAVSASRPIVDQGWLPLTRQVGKSGMTVKPKLYLALGISGAPEHQEGMRDAPLIIAINTDPGAPIFDIAHYGATVDCVEFMESMKAAVGRRQSAR